MRERVLRRENLDEELVVRHERDGEPVFAIERREFDLTHATVIAECVLYGVEVDRRVAAHEPPERHPGENAGRNVLNPWN